MPRDESESKSEFCGDFDLDGRDRKKELMSLLRNGFSRMHRRIRIPALITNQFLQVIILSIGCECSGKASDELVKHRRKLQVWIPWSKRQTCKNQVTGLLWSPPVPADVTGTVPTQQESTERNGRFRFTTDACQLKVARCSCPACCRMLQGTIRCYSATVACASGSRRLLANHDYRGMGESAAELAWIRAKLIPGS